MSKPTIVLVPGSFSTPVLYESLSSAFVAQGFETQIVPLVSAGRRDPQLAGTTQDDADAIAAAVSKLVDAGKDVVLLPHSYGGVPTTMAAKGLLKKDRQVAGKSGGVVRIVYVTCIIVREGESVSSVMASVESQNIKVDGDYMQMIDMEVLAKQVFSDLPLEQSLVWARQMSDHSLASFSGELTYAAYADVPVSYIYCTQDLVLVPEVQDKFIQTIRDQGGQVQVLQLDTGHAPGASKPQELVRLVSEAIAAT